MKLTSIAKRVLLKNHLVAVIVWLLFLLISASSIVIAPLFIKRIIDEGVDLNALTNKSIWAFSFITIIGMFSLYMVKNQTINLQFIIDMEIKKELYSAMLKSDFLDLEKLNMGEKYSKIDMLAKHLSADLFTNGIVKSITIFVYSICFLIVFFSLNKYLGFSMLALGIIYTLVKINAIRDIGIKSRHHQDALNADTISLNKVTQELKEIKIENQVDEEIEAFNELINREVQTGRRVAKAHEIEARFFYEAALAISSILAILFLTLYSKDFSSGSIIASIIIMSLYYLNLNQLTKIRFDNRNYEEDIKELEALLNVREENRVVSVNEVGELNSIVFDHVSFKYANSDFELSNISFDLEKGDSLCIYGALESGRSTISYILAKVLRPRQGKVLINGIDLKKVDTTYLRSILSITSSASIMKPVSIKENIIQGLPMDEYRYNDAITKCMLKEFIKNLPNKDLTIFSETDEVFSADIIEKILLARSFYKDPSIFVMDNCASKMKLVDAYEILDEAIKNKRKITIVISDKPSTISKCTKVLLLEDGKQVEFGYSKDLAKNPESRVYQLIQIRGRQ